MRRTGKASSLFSDRSPTSKLARLQTRDDEQATEVRRLKRELQRVTEERDILKKRPRTSPGGSAGQGLGDRHHLHPHARGLLLPGRRARPLLAPRRRLAEARRLSIVTKALLNPISFPINARIAYTVSVFRILPSPDRGAFAPALIDIRRLSLRGKIRNRYPNRPFEFIGLRRGDYLYMPRRNISPA